MKAISLLHQLSYSSILIFKKVTKLINRLSSSEIKPIYNLPIDSLFFIAIYIHQIKFQSAFCMLNKMKSGFLSVNYIIYLHTISCLQITIIVCKQTSVLHKGNNKITEHRTIFQRERQNS